MEATANTIMAGFSGGVYGQIRRFRFISPAPIGLKVQPLNGTLPAPKWNHPVRLERGVSTKVNYSKAEAKAWAKENWHGLCNVIMPSFSADLKSINEAAIRHDVRRNIELGYWGALVVSECATTDEEYIRFMEIVVDEAGDRQKFLLHGTWDTTDDLIRMCEAAESIGLEGVLLGHPNSYYYTAEKEVYNYIKYAADNTNLAIVTFAAPQWDFARIDAVGYPIDTLLKVGEIDNVVACKFEVGGIAGGYEFYKRNQNNVLYSDPRMQFLPISVDMFEMQWAGTSCFEVYGGVPVQLFNMFRGGKYDDAMDLYWKMSPVRKMRAALSAHLAGSNFIHRYLWKFWGWLHGYNGGPLRQPTNRLVDSQMNTSRSALTKAGFDIDPNETNGDFFVGRHPI